MKSETKAVSTLTLIILLTCSVIFTGLITYLLVMANYYNLPQPSATIENAVFPILDAKYFNVTILNPSNSAFAANVTAIKLRVEGENQVYDITEADPYLPYSIRIGTKQTFKCEQNWSNFTGEMVIIEPVIEDFASTSQLFTTPNVKLELNPKFDPQESVEYFNLTVENSAESIINLTISEITLARARINEIVTPTLPYKLSPAQTVTFRCDWNWEGYSNFKITTKTEEGYESTYAVGELPIAALYVADIKFENTDVTSFDLVIASSEDSTSGATVAKINITLQDGRTIPINSTNPPLGPISGLIFQNQSRTFKCFWDWNEYRNKNFTVNPYTQEGFTAQGKKAKTPPEVIWNLTNTNFDLDHTNYFLINVKNMPISLHTINITRIEIDEKETVLGHQLIPAGEERQFNCTTDWKDFIGEEVEIDILAYDFQNEEILNISRLVEIPPVGLKILNDNFIYGDLYDPDVNIAVPYFNITVSNSNNSIHNVTIVKVALKAENITRDIDGMLTHPQLIPDGYLLNIGEITTIVCPSDWTQFILRPVTVTFYTLEGIEVTRTWFAT